MPHSSPVASAADAGAAAAVPHARPGLDRLQRWTDCSLVLVTLPVWFLVLAVTLIATRVGSRGTLFFHQTRLGRDCRPFTIHKVRTMRPGLAPPAGALFAGWTYAGDPRVTRTGAFLRRYRLDELPQLWNVLRGDMSLIGPRPEPLDIAERLGEELPGYHQRHAVRPGLTGLCQISAVYRDFGTIDKAARKLEYDLAYVRTRSVRLNAWILWCTVAVLGRGEGMA